MTRNDSEIRQDVLEELEWEPAVNANRIGVAVENGVVTLSGHVFSYGEKRAAEQATVGVKGVKAIAEELEVIVPFSTQHTDVEIAQAVVNALKGNSRITEVISVKVESGVVTLNGDVPNKYERETAKQAIEQIAGMRGIINLISVSEQPATIA